MENVVELNWNNYKSSTKLIEREMKLMYSGTKYNGARSYVATRQTHPMLVNVEDGIQK